MTVEECFDRVMQETVPENKAAWHEWATIKAYLGGMSRIEHTECYTELFGTEPQELKTAPKWLIMLACMWKGAELGHKRVKRLFSGVDKQSLALLAKLDESALNLNKSLKAHIRTGNGDILC
jgi:hypothetical protein